MIKRWMNMQEIMLGVVILSALYMLYRIAKSLAAIEDVVTTWGALHHLDEQLRDQKEIERDAAIDRYTDRP